MAVQREKARLLLQQRLDSTKTQAERNRLGQFQTPPHLAHDIVVRALELLPPRSKIRFLEPGFGTGPFCSALQQLVRPSRIEALVGYEIDPYYAEPAQEIWKGTGLDLRAADFTEAVPPPSETGRFNLLVCNPPYVRHHHIDPARKRDLQTCVYRYTGLRMNGLGGLHTYFIVLSKTWMAQDGVGAWLVPSEFMDVNYGRALKQFLTEAVTLHRVHRFDPDDVQFNDALVSSAVLLFRNAPPPADHQVEFSFGGTLAHPKSSQNVRLEVLRIISKWTSLPATATAFRQEARITLGDLFWIKRGVATGCNKFFVLTPAQAAERHLPSRFLTPILPSPRDLDSDEIPADVHGNPMIAKRLLLLTCDLPEADVWVKYPALARYLDEGKAAGISERYLSRHRDPWYSQERRPPAPLLCTYMGRTTHKSDVPFRFILNHSKATAANVYLLLYPKPPLASSLKGAPEVARAVWTALSRMTAATLTREGRVYGGGLHKLEPKELANVPADALLKVLNDVVGFRIPEQLKLFWRVRAG